MTRNNTLRYIHRALFPSLILVPALLGYAGLLSAEEPQNDSPDIIDAETTPELMLNQYEQREAKRVAEMEKRAKKYFSRASVEESIISFSKWSSSAENCSCPISVDVDWQTLDNNDGYHMVQYYLGLVRQNLIDFCKLDAKAVCQKLSKIEFKTDKEVKLSLRSSKLVIAISTDSISPDLLRNTLIDELKIDIEKIAEDTHQHDSEESSSGKKKVSEKKDKKDLEKSSNKRKPIKE